MLHYLFPNNSETTKEFLSKPDRLLKATPPECVLSWRRTTEVETVPLRTTELGVKLEKGLKVFFSCVKRFSEDSLYNLSEGIFYVQ